MMNFYPRMAMLVCCLWISPVCAVEQTSKKGNVGYKKISEKLEKTIQENNERQKKYTEREDEEKRFYNERFLECWESSRNADLSGAPKIHIKTVRPTLMDELLEVERSVPSYELKKLNPVVLYKVVPQTQTSRMDELLEVEKSTPAEKYNEKSPQAEKCKHLKTSFSFAKGPAKITTYRGIKSINNGWILIETDLSKN